MHHIIEFKWVEKLHFMLIYLYTFYPDRNKHNSLISILIGKCHDLHSSISLTFDPKHLRWTWSLLGTYKRIMSTAWSSMKMYIS